MRRAPTYGKTWKNGTCVIPDPPIDRPERPCASCRAIFKPTARRRMLCAKCYKTSRPERTYGEFAQRVQDRYFAKARIG